MCLMALASVTSCFFKSAEQQAELEPDAVREPEHIVRWGICVDSLDVEDLVIGNGEVLSQILTRYGVSQRRIHDIDRISDSTFSVRKLRTNRPYHIIREHDSVATARFFVYDIKKSHSTISLFLKLLLPQLSLHLVFFCLFLLREVGLRNKLHI